MAIYAGDFSFLLSLNRSLTYPLKKQQGVEFSPWVSPTATPF